VGAVPSNRAKSAALRPELDLLDDSRPPHLGHDLLPRGEPTAMRLRDGRGGEQPRIEADERVLTEVLEQHGLDLR
jgi:hypothetical protein